MSKDKKWVIGRNLKTDGLEGGVRPNMNIPRTETLIGDVHTHPYSKKDGAIQGLGFSGIDMDKLREFAGIPMYTMMVEAGSSRYAAIISDPDKAKKFFQTFSRQDIIGKADIIFNKGSGPLQKRLEKAMFATFGDGSSSGVTVFVANDKAKRNFKKIGK